MWTGSNRESMLKFYFAYKNDHFIESSKTSQSPQLPNLRKIAAV